MVNVGRFGVGYIVYIAIMGLNIYGFISAGEQATQNILF